MIDAACHCRLYLAARVLHRIRFIQAGSQRAGPVRQVFQPPCVSAFAGPCPRYVAVIDPFQDFSRILRPVIGILLQATTHQVVIAKFFPRTRYDTGCRLDICHQRFMTFRTDTCPPSLRDSDPTQPRHCRGYRHAGRPPDCVAWAREPSRFAGPQRRYGVRNRRPLNRDPIVTGL